MAEPIMMPKVSMGQTEGQIAQWLVDEGQWVEKGQMVMEMETEKVSYECEAPASGFLHIQIQPGQVVPVGETIALLAATEQELAALQAGNAGAAAAESNQEASATEESRNASNQAPQQQALRQELPHQAAVVQDVAPLAPLPSPSHEVSPSLAAPNGLRQGKKIKISPVAKKKAKAYQLDISQIVGSGPGGRIVNRDIERVLAERVSVQGVESVRSVEREPLVGSAQAVLSAGEVLDGKRVKATLPLKGMRKAIANHLMHSLTVSAQLSYMGELDMTQIIRLRKKLLQKEGEIGLRITYNDLLVMILAKAVKQVPQVNASLMGDEIKIWEDINVGIAVAVELGPYESGLVVPVLRGAGQKSLIEISQLSKALTNKARAGKLTAEDVAGGTITLSNLGGFAPGWSLSTPILNQPQAVMVQPGAIVEKPVVRDGQIVIRPMMTLSITFDHRILDGVPIMKLHSKIIELVENPEFLHL